MSEQKKVRLDRLLLERGLAESRSRAQWLIRQGLVRCAGQTCRRPGRRLAHDTPLQITQRLPYVSRGGLKLAHALQAFALPTEGAVALDVGASTGGFTDCLLQAGVRRVYAVDVGKGQLHPRLESDSRVISLEETDIRDLSTLPGETKADIAVVDVSFISLRLVLPAVVPLLHPHGELVCLIKPQFEAGRRAVNRQGVVRRARDRQRALEVVLQAAAEEGLVLAGLCPAPSDSRRGNIEYLAHLRRGGRGLPLQETIEGVVRQSAPDVKDSLGGS